MSFASLLSVPTRDEEIPDVFVTAGSRQRTERLGVKVPKRTKETSPIQLATASRRRGGRSARQSYETPQRVTNGSSSSDEAFGKKFGNSRRDDVSVNASWEEPVGDQEAAEPEPEPERRFNPHC